MGFPTELANDLTVIVSVPDAKTTGQLIQFHWPTQWKEKINKASCPREMTQLGTDAAGRLTTPTSTLGFIGPP